MRRFFIPAVLFLIPWPMARAADLPPRAEWTGSGIHGTPEPPLPFRSRPRFATHAFAQPIDLVPLPGTDLLAIAELGGRIRAFSSARDEEAPILLLDGKKSLPGLRQLFSVTADPGFATNRRFYLFYKTADDHPLGTTVARIEMRGEGREQRLDPATLRLIVQWHGGGHNGGSLQFGPDGMLYLSTGDGTAPWPPDSMNVGQTLDNLLSSVLRLDVSGDDPQQAYRIPPDNPFTQQPGAKPEIWAFGFRNPWRFSFDRDTGALWLGDVGWELWEMIYRVERGGNYGWPIMEGPQPIRTDVQPGPGDIRPPLVSHPHTEARSITGGWVYRGKKLPQLQGQYVYGDYETGKIWSLPAAPPAADAPLVPRLIADTPFNLVSFGQDAEGELYLLDFSGGIHELVPRDPAAPSPPFPHQLSATGLFTDTAAQKPAAGVVPYALHAPLWCDGLEGERWIGLPGPAAIQPGNDSWKFPPGTALAKTLSLPAAPGRPARRIETRLMHFDGEEWRAYSYKWRNDQQDADLVDSDGHEELYPAEAGAFRHRFEARGTCLVCHNFWSGYVLGFSAPQLEGAGEISLKQWMDRGYLTRLPPRTTPPLVDPRDEKADLGARSRSWLHVHCAHCHKREAGGSASLLLSAHLPLDRAHLIDEKPAQGDFGLKDARLVAPGDPMRSVLYYRLATTGIGHMPRLGGETVDENALELIYRWIAGLSPQGEIEPAWKELPRPPEELLAETSLALRLRRQLVTGSLSAEEKTRVIQQALASPRPEIRGLFERWAQTQARPDRLGPQPRPEKILALTGDVPRGRELYFSSAAAVCRACHRVGNEGGAIGPDLSQVGAKLKRAEILESLLDPARRVEPAWRLFNLKTRDGRERTGSVIEQDTRRLLWRDPAGVTSEIPASDVASLTPLPGSLMPGLLLKDFTAQEAADLVDYLQSLK